MTMGELYEQLKSEAENEMTELVQAAEKRTRERMELDKDRNGLLELIASHLMDAVELLKATPLVVEIEQLKRDIAELKERPVATANVTVLLPEEVDRLGAVAVNHAGALNHLAHENAELRGRLNVIETNRLNAEAANTELSARVGRLESRTDGMQKDLALLGQCSEDALKVAKSQGLRLGIVEGKVHDIEQLGDKLPY